MEDEYNLDDIVSTIGDFKGVGPYESIEMVQHDSEIKGLARRVSELNPSTVMEIGTKLGGTFYLWSRYLNASTLISLDLPGGDFGGGYPEEKIKLLDDFAPNTTSHFVRADSHDSTTAKEIKPILGDNNTVDFLFIDGDHTYEGVKQDFNMYKEFVSEGGIIAFHDICYHPSEGVEVERFWSEIKDNYESEEIIGPERALFGLGGIGLIYK
jgi:cephalosporin hydroxylase